MSAAVRALLLALGLALAGPGLGQTLYFVQVDHLNTPRLVENAAQQAVWRWEQWEPFGQNPADENPSGLGAFEFPLRFPGQYADKETNLHYNYFRDYDPQIGRYVQSDPVGLRGGINTYTYVGGKPLSSKDPLGLWFGIDDLAFAGIGAVVGLGARYFGDVFTGNRSTWEDYVGAAVGGAVGGEALLYTANPFIAGAAGGLAGNLTAQAVKNISGRQCGVDFGSAAFDAGFGALTGFIPGRPRLAGVNTGRGSDLQVFRQISTKAQNGSIHNITASTARRMVQGAYYEYAVGQGAAAGAIGSTIYGGFSQQP